MKRFDDGNGKYKDCQILKDELKGKKFILDCGHHATIGHLFATNVVIVNDSTKNGGDSIKIICTSCYD